MTESLNIIIAGRSGVGKSSFLNYLIGEERFKTGDGVPVTATYFEDVFFASPDSGVAFHLLDTKGIEPDSAEECKEVILQKIRENDASDDIFQWIHTVYYCLDASAKRVQPFELDFLRDLLKSVSVVVLLTKKDLVSETDLEGLRRQVRDEMGTSVQMVSVCSVEKRTRKGCSEREGKADVLKASFLGLWNKMSRTLPQQQAAALFPSDSTLTLHLEHALQVSLQPKPADADTDKWVLSVKRIRAVANARLTLDFLCNFPTLSECAAKEWDTGSREDIKQLISNTHYALWKYSYDQRNIDVDKRWQKNENIHKTVFDFYKKMNRVKPHILYSYNAKDAFTRIKQYPLVARMKEAESLESLLQAKIDAIAACHLFDKTEKKEAAEAYNEYRDKVMQIATDLQNLINEFIISYKSELYQYGQCCIRKDDQASDTSGVSSMEDLNTEERVYHDVLLLCLSDNEIDEKERAVLDKLRVVLGIVPQRAGLIEDFVRRGEVR